MGTNDSDGIDNRRAAHFRNSSRYRTLITALRNILIPNREISHLSMIIPLKRHLKKKENEIHVAEEA